MSNSAHSRPLALPLSPPDLDPDDTDTDAHSATDVDIDIAGGELAKASNAAHTASTALHRGAASADNAEFSPDIKPVCFKMNTPQRSSVRSTHTPQHSHPHPHPLASGTQQPPRNTQEILSQVRQQLMRRGGSLQGPASSTGSSLGSSNEGIHVSSTPQIFHSIDIDQFESYLREPRYIKVLKKARHVKQFRRLFLAQELRATDPDPDEISAVDAAAADFAARAGGGGGVYPARSAANSAAASTPSTPGTTPRLSGMFSHGTPSSVRDSGTEASQGGAGSRAIWASKFSHDGKYLATAGRDGTVRVWKVISSPIERLELNSSLESSIESHVRRSRIRTNTSSSDTVTGGAGAGGTADLPQESLDLYAPVFHPLPVRVFREHTQDVLDLDWSKNNFLVTSSMDKTVKLWHPERKTSLKTFFHPDFVTSVAFHPADDRFFLSGCLDHKCRLWSIVDNEVSYDFDCRDLITAVAFSPDGGKYTVIGTFNGYVYLLVTNGLAPISSFHVTDKKTQVDKPSASVYPDETRAHHGPRITGLTVFVPPTDPAALRVLATANDSRIRVFDLNTKKMLEIIKGFHSGTLSHSAQLSVTNGMPYVICGSDDSWIYCWKLRSSAPDEGASAPNTDSSASKLAKESAGGGGIKRSNSLKNLFTRPLSRSSSQSSGSGSSRGDDLAALTMTNMNSTGKEKASSSTTTTANGHHDGSRRHSLLAALIPGYGDYIKNRSYMAFHAHRAPVTNVTIAPIETAKTLSLSNDVICELFSEFSTNDDDADFVRVKGSTLSPTTSIDSASTFGDLRTGSNTLGSAVSAIGSIVVSTDSQGTIRVFRTDIPTVIRKRVLKRIQEYKAEERYRINSAQSLYAMGCNANSLSNINVNRTRSFNSLANLNQAGGKHTGNTFFNGKGTKPIIRSPSMNNSLYSYATAHTSIPNGNNMYNSPNESFSSSFIGELPQNIRCDVCHGSNFKPISKTGLVKAENSYFCADCGNVLNSFR
ncbi:Laf1 protein [Maudiozyma humilis]|uniref:Laf1 protein n=1 Tax=Maudiozyma humilis TaxID=51915 RepID=A0AAV5RVL3_MAUHU|nr:Laf1 protein [Kazachstania humilis]